ncbi:hypothetical protein [Allorhizobium taibaishanense]|uniref:Uncharacterized protein n=1 Tax=Allorhizobium taibaishanense TaxID=887144 RepID=A0A1Q9AC30_9HYPH|nr:hypothetical protein [Allorhizobium taibaishanense]MBB4010682.1 hypothetical protein [Allorhizobium taibaishanense]OLP52427.1 hypothetical protein BJF91_09565 [Allorhizobium taibaishanense]
MQKNPKHNKRSREPKPSSKPAKAASRAGSNAGRGFRYQDAVSAWMAVEIWAGQRAPAIVIPEGGDDIELRGEATSFVQVKSRREHLGDYTEGETAGHIEDLWNRSFCSAPQPQRLELVLEREVEGLSPLNDHPAVRWIKGPISTRLAKFNGSSDLLRRTSIVVATSPQEWAIGLIVNRLNCAPIAAQMCFAELLVRVGSLADANGRLASENYRGVSISDTETTIRDVMAAIDIDAIEQALMNGVCEPVDFLTPLNDPNFYLGVDVEPGHIAAGLVAERPRSRSALVAGIEQRRAALIVGPSGAGKSALMWEAANSLRHTVRWFRIRRLSAADIPSLRQLVRTFRASEDSPLGFVMDDVGRNGPESWGALLKEAMSVPGVVLLGSVREEDVTLIAERARAAEIRADPDDELAERLWRELREAGMTNWAGWYEPWKMSNGLLLEYVHILARGQRMHELLADQVAARVSDPKRSLELDILRSGAWAGAANAEVDASRLARALSVSEADLSRALQRLIEEHLVRSPAPGAVTGLHKLRSEELLQLTHQTILPTLKTSFERTVASVPATDLEPLVADTLSARRLPVPAVLDGLISRLEGEQDARALASVLRGLGSGRVSSGVDEWLDTPEARALPRTQIGSAAMLGIAGIDLSSLAIIPEVQAAADRLSQIKGSPEDDPRRLLMERMSPSALSALIETADLASLDDILAALVGMPLPAAVRTSLVQVPEGLLNANLDLLGSLMGTLSTLDREIASHWVAEVGQEALFARVQAETAWAGPVITEGSDDGVIVRCDLWYVAGSVQENQHDAVVGLCELILALCPSADIAVSNAITAGGELAGLAQLPLATKRIPRDNLPPPSVPQWNRRWRDLISRRVAAPSYSDYLARGVAILDALVPTLEKVFDAHFRGKDALGNLADKLNALNADTEALTPPTVSSLEASGAGHEEANTAVTKFQNLLHSASVNLVKRFAILPNQAGAYIAWLSDLITDADTTIVEEPWHLIGDGPPLMLNRLKTLLETLRLLAGEAHENKQAPTATWSARGKGARVGNSVRLVSLSARAAGETRLAQRKAGIERLAEEAGIAAQFHLRVNAKGILPWPPADVLALLPAPNVADAVVTLAEQAELVRSFVDPSIHLTIMPYIEGVAFPALGKSGYQTLLPDMEGAAFWAEQLGLPQAPSTVVSMFGEVLTLASELGAMDQKRLGDETRPEEEIAARRSLEAAFERKYEELTRRLNAFDQVLQSNVSELIEHLRIGDVDFAAEAQAAIGGTSSNIAEAAGYVSLLLMSAEIGEMPIDGQTIKSVHTTESEQAVDGQE